MKNQTQPRTIAKKIHSNVIDKTPPHSEELEANVLGACLVDNSLFTLINPILQPKYFFQKKNEVIYRCMLDLVKEDAVINPVTVASKLNDKDELMNVGGPAYLAGLSSAFSSPETVVFSANKIKENWIKRDLEALAVNLSTQSFDPNINAKELIYGYQVRLSELAQLIASQDSLELAHYIREAYDYIEEVKEKRIVSNGIPTGFQKLDEILGGCHKGELIIIAGRPSHGKTSLALDIARHASAHENYRIGVWSLEMSGLELALKQVCAECKVDLAKLRAGKITSHEYDIVKEGYRKVVERGSRIILNDSGSIDALTLGTEARKLKQDGGLDLIVVDYIQLMNAYDGWRGERHLEIAFITRCLKQLAKELDLPVIALSQLSRKIEDRAGIEKRPQLSDLRESGAIEQDADVVIFVHRPEMYLREEDAEMGKWKGLAEVIVGKQRNGPIGHLKLAFIHEYATFENYIPEIEPEYYKEMDEI
jgi:replicative DNA helicase